MQDKLGGPRSGNTIAEVDEVLLHAVGGRIRAGVDFEDSSGDLRGPVRLYETTDTDWNAGTVGSGLTVAQGSVTGT